MSEWKEYKFSNIGKIVTGKTPRTAISDNYGGKIPFLSPSDDMQTKYVPITARCLTEKGLSEVKNCLIPSNSICVSCIGSDMGKSVITKEPIVTNQQINSIIPSNEFDSNFIYYVMQSKRKEIRFMGGNGTAVPILNKTAFSNLTFFAPSLFDQRRIASILSSLDDKIAVNRRICENLEAQAQALFKHWFIDFAPYKNRKFVESELGIIPLSEISEQITDGVHNSVKDEPNSNYMLLSCKNIVGGVLSKNSYRSISKSTFESLRLRTKLAKGDVLLSSVGTIGEIAIVEEEPINYEFQRSVAIVKPKKTIGTYFLYNALLASKARLQHAAHGAVQQCLFIGDLKKFEVIYSDTEKASRYNETVKPLFEEIANLHQENLRLSSLRDTLLPKLMSGEIKV
ncbi:MAG: restriction endonuclease subunit S [Bacteroidales bacterium]|nr:restriction endonuclease subunit S [Bacteroidales bacterium]